jgi:hypothetical protein
MYPQLVILLKSQTSYPLVRLHFQQTTLFSLGKQRNDFHPQIWYTLAVMSKLILDNKYRVGLWVAQEVGQTADWGDFQAFGIERDGEIVAGFVFHLFNGANAVCHVAVKKYTRLLPELLKVSSDYLFNHCKLKRLTGFVPTNEPHVIKLDKHFGFEEEFVMKDAAPGADMQVLVMWADKCPWLPKE